MRRRGDFRGMTPVVLVEILPETLKSASKEGIKVKIGYYP
jgi:hypothetical protein